jgi:putative zinc finger/helix-turn-helix YgiT family protein
MRMRRGKHRYDACGLPGVTLVGVAVSRCPQCDEVEVSIPNIEGLHKVIARALARKLARLTPAEIRFLRKYLGFSSADFAQLMGVRSESVSRWEHGRAAMGISAERLLRMLAVTREPLSEYPLDEVRVMGEQGQKAIKLDLRMAGGLQWRPMVEPAAVYA